MLTFAQNDEISWFECLICTYSETEIQNCITVFLIHINESRVYRASKLSRYTRHSTFTTWWLSYTCQGLPQQVPFPVWVYPFRSIRLSGQMVSSASANPCLSQTTVSVISNTVFPHSVCCAGQNTQSPIPFGAHLHFLLTTFKLVTSRADWWMPNFYHFRWVTSKRRFLG